MEIDLTKPMALPEAVRSLGARTPVGTALRTEELEGLPLALRKRAFFSAGVESARFLERAKRAIDKSISQFGVNRDRASFVKEMQDLATEMGIRPTDGTRGTLIDIGSARRLRLIYDTQVAMARNEADWRDGQQEAVLNAYPAQELVRVEDREEPRDWPQRWRDAGGQFYGGQRMIALKVDPIWIAISRFDQPWPPFDFNSGMGVRDVRRREAVELGLLERGQRLEPVAADYDAQIEAGLQGLSEPVAVGLQTFFGRTAATAPDGQGIALVAEQAPPLRHVLMIDSGAGPEARQAAVEGLEAIDAVHGIDEDIEALHIEGDFSGADEFVAEVGRILITEGGRGRKEMRALREAIDEAPGRVWDLDAGELLGRAYAQFIRGESGDVRLAGEGLWGDEIFEPIKQAFLGLLRALGWLREK